MTTVRETKRAAQIAAIHGLADWLAEHPNMPMPTLSLHRHLGSGDGTDVENLASVRSLAEQIGVGTDESLEDRTVLRYRVNEHVWYELFAWHKDGRGNLAELERLRARLAELEAQHGIPAEPTPEPMTDAELDEVLADANQNIVEVLDQVVDTEAGLRAIKDPTGLSYTRADDEPDDPTPVSPARVPMHTGAMTGGLVDETPAEHRLVGGSVGGFGENSAECACGVIFDGFDSATEANQQLDLHIEAATSPTGLTKAFDESRGPLAGTSPVVAYFSFGYGQSDPDTGKSLLDHYVTVVASTYEACREAMFASRFGRAWSFDYLAGRAHTTEWVSQWTEHEVIVAPGTDREAADAVLKVAAELLAASES